MRASENAMDNDRPPLDGAGIQAEADARKMRIHPLNFRLKNFRQGQGLLRSRIGSILHLISGNVGDAVIMLAGLSIAARALGSADFGTMAIVLTIGRLCERLLRFESWQPLVRYAAQEEAENDPTRLSRLYLYGLLLDIGSALLAACLTVGAGFALAGLLQLDNGGTMLVAIYACAIAVNIRGMPSAALRLAGKFKTIAYFQIVANSLRLIMAIVCYLNGAGLLAFVLVWTVAQIIDSLLFCFLGFRTLRRDGIPSPWRADWHNLRRDFPGFLGFAFATNLSSSMRTLTQEADTLLVGIFAGKVAAGFYHLAKRMARIAQQVGVTVQTVIYPDLARMWSKSSRKAFGRLVGTVQAMLAAIAISAVAVAWLAGDKVIELVFGKEFAGSYPLLLTQLVAVLLILHAAPTRSALLAMNRPGYVLRVASASTILFFAVAFYAIPRFGALGANLAHIAFGGLTAILLDIAFWRGVAASDSPADSPVGGRPAKGFDA
jgi:O-antigen/teichoic acid export membrane protein